VHDGMAVTFEFQAAVIATCACASEPSSSDAVGGDMPENEAVQAAPLGVPTSRDEVAARVNESETAVA
jgi:hypothetical protein